jgi:hypothetical protein
MRETEPLFRTFRLIKRLVLGALALVAGLVIVGYTLFMSHVDAPGARAAAERELKGSVLGELEAVRIQAPVFQRRGADYFRGAVGLLAATDERLVFVGIAPRERLEGEDAPNIVLTHEFSNDTLLQLNRARVYGWTSPGVIVSRAGQREVFAATRGASAKLDSLISFVVDRQQRQRAAAARERRIRAAASEAFEQPISYIVKRGDALSTVAKKFEVTPEQLREWNSLEGDRIRIGQQLIVRPKGGIKANSKSE